MIGNLVGLWPSSVDFGEFPDVDVGVNQGRVEAGVTEHFLNMEPFVLNEFAFMDSSGGSGDSMVSGPSIS